MNNILGDNKQKKRKKRKEAVSLEEKQTEKR